MKYIEVGKIATTHGLKGELKINSFFKYKNLVFKENNILYLGKNYEPHEIISYRSHQQHDMVIFKDLDDIDKAIKYKGYFVYIDRKSIKLENDYLKEDLIGLTVYYKDKEVGKIIDAFDGGNGNEIIVLDNKLYIPKKDNFIEKVDLLNKKIYLKNIEGLIL